MRLPRRSMFALIALCALPAHAADGGAVTSTRVSNSHAILHLDDGRDVLLADIIVPAAAPTLARFKGDEVLLQAEDEDRYGRLTAIAKPRGGRQPTIEETLLAAGEALTYSPGMLHQWDRWQQAEHDAEMNHRGWWSDHGVTTPGQAQQKLQQFVIIEGRVSSTHEARDAYHIYFGPAAKPALTLTIPRTDWRSFDGVAIAPGDLVRARGTLISQDGPTLILTHNEQLETQHADAQ